MNEHCVAVFVLALLRANIDLLQQRNSKLQVLFLSRFTIMINGTAHTELVPTADCFLYCWSLKTDKICIVSHFLSLSFPARLYSLSCLNCSGQMTCVAPSLSSRAPRPSGSSKKRSTTPSSTTLTRARSASFYTVSNCDPESTMVKDFSLEKIKFLAGWISFAFGN